MDITTIIAAIDQEVSTRKSPRFGIMFGGELYKALAQAGKIKMATFSVWGTGAFPEELPAYDGKYFASHNWQLDDWDFKVGSPSS